MSKQWFIHRLAVRTACGLALAIVSAPGAARAEFTEVITIPTEHPNIGNSESISSDTQVNLLEGGSIGSFFSAGNSGSTNIEVNIDGGTVGQWFRANKGSVVNVSAGTVGDNLEANYDSVVNISGGIIGNLRVFATANLRGGTMGSLSIFGGGAINVYGSEMRLDGVLIEGLNEPGGSLPIDWPSQGVLSGTLEDGTPFAISAQDDDYLYPMTATLHAVALPAVGPPTILASTDPLPLGIREGQTLIVDNGSTVGDHFNAGWGSAVAVQSGGTVGNNFEATGSTVTFAGEVGDNFGAFSGSVVTIAGPVGDNASAVSGSVLHITSGGSVGPGLRAFDSTVNVTGNGIVAGVAFQASSSEVNIGDESSVGRLHVTDSIVNISGDGSVDDFSSATSGSVVNIFGGMVGGNFSATHSEVNVYGGSIGNAMDLFSGTVNIRGGNIGSGFDVNSGTVNISGGSVGDDFDANTGSTINIFGTDFLLDGEEISGLFLDEPFTIENRDVPLSGILADGTPFSFDLNSSDVTGEDYFPTGATVTITLISRLVGDYNDDGVVDAADYAVWRQHLGETYTLPNEEPTATPGEVTEHDFEAWRLNFGNAAPPGALPNFAAIPEPATGLLLSSAAVWLIMPRLPRPINKRPRRLKTGPHC